jgi:site-specific recombinase XerD
MKLCCLITDYVAFRQSLGQKFTSCRNLLQAFCHAVGSEIDVKDVDRDRVLSFLGPPVTSYWHRKYSTLTCFYRYAISRGHVSSSPLPTTVPKIPPRFVPYIYTHDDIRRLLNATASYRQIHILLEPYTFRMILLLLYGAGLRISEALSLRMADVDFSEAVLLIRETKFYKSRLVPIGTHLQEAMVRFAAARREAGHSELPDSPFFLGRKGDPLRIHTVQQSFRQLRAHAGIRRSDDARYQPRLHDLRHAFAVNRLVAWYKAGADVQRLLPKLSTYLGHISLSSTQRYLTMTPVLLQEACGRFERYVIGESADE